MNKFKPETEDDRVSRNIHFLYVTVFCDAVFIAAAAIASAFFPIYDTDAKISLDRLVMIESYTADLVPEPGKIINVSLFVFLIVGIFFAFAFSIVVNRLSLVAVAGREQEMVPLSRPARWGRALLGWRGGVFLVALIIVFVTLSSMRTVYYASTFTGKVPGLQSWRPLQVRLWTALKLYENPKPDIRESLAAAMTGDNNADVRFVAALTLAGMKDKRAVGPLIEFYETRRGAHKEIKKLLIPLDSRDMVPKLHALFKRSSYADHATAWIASLILLRGGDDLRSRVEKSLKNKRGFSISPDILRNWDEFKGTTGTDLDDKTYRDSLVRDLREYYTIRANPLRRY